MGNLAFDENRAEVPLEVMTASVMKPELVQPALTQYIVAGIVINALDLTELKEQLVLHFQDYVGEGEHHFEIGYMTEYMSGLVRFTVHKLPEQEESIDRQV